MTNSTFKSDEELKVNFLSAHDETAGGISILLKTIPQYRFHNCMEAALCFPTKLPSDTTKIWRITLARTSPEVRVTIHCNDQEVLNIVLTDKVCFSMLNVWKTSWGEEVAGIQFPSSYSAADFYRAYTPVPPPGI